MNVLYDRECIVFIVSGVECRPASVMVSRFFSRNACEIFANSQFLSKFETGPGIYSFQFKGAQED